MNSGHAAPGVGIASFVPVTRSMIYNQACLNAAIAINGWTPEPHDAQDFMQGCLDALHAAGCKQATTVSRRLKDNSPCE